MITYNKLGKYGRFGNQLFHIASTIGIAIRNGYEYAFPLWDEWRHFKNHLPFIPDNDLAEQKLKGKSGGLLIEYEEFLCYDNVSLLGHFFSEKYFKHCEKDIRHYFEMIPIKGLPEIKENSICIHVRAGDFGTKQFPRLPREYYSRALYSIAEKDHIREIFVFSDNIKEAKKVFKHVVFFITYIETNSYIKDFYLMTKCKHFIIANSTFSWWAAWLGKHKDKIVIAPKNMDTAMYTDEMYPNEWIRL